MSPDRVRRKARYVALRFRRALAGRRFARDRRGAAAVEFALIAIPFFAVLFASLETGLIFFAEQTMESGVAKAARLIRTGQAQSGKFDESKFREAVCHYMIVASNCMSSIRVDVRTFKSFKTADFSRPTEKQLQNPNFKYDPGIGGDIVLVRTFYEWPTFFNFMGYNMSDLSNGKRLLAAASTFRNEPF